MNTDKRVSIKFVVYTTLLIIQFIIFSIYLVPQISTDLWNDEIYTLKHFTFVPLMKTCTDYHVPNNHIFFNLVNNLYLRMTGIHSLDNLMDYPWVIRLVSLLYSLLSLFVMYLTGRKFFNRSTAYISVILLLTSIPFLNYATQVRGYGLSMLCFTAILYNVL